MAADVFFAWSGYFWRVMCLFVHFFEHFDGTVGAGAFDGSVFGFRA